MSTPPIFYARPYLGRFTDYVPQGPTVDFVASPVLAVETDLITPQERHAGHDARFRTLWQGACSDQRLYDYSYGKSDPVKRPEISPLEDLEWLATLHTPTKRWLESQGHLLAGVS